MNLESFLKIENKFNLYTDSIESINYWEICRFTIWNYLFCSTKLELGIPHRSNTNRISGKLKIGVSLIKNLLFKNKIRRKNIDILFFDHQRRVKNGLYYECIYTDELSKLYNSLVFEQPYKGYHLQPVNLENIFYTDFINLKAKIYSDFHIKFKTKYYHKIYNIIKNKLETPLEEMFSSYGISISKEKIYLFVLSSVLKYKKQRIYYKQLLKKINPKIIVEVCHYCISCMAINDIASEMNIPTYELQHGTMHKEHSAYQYSCNENLKQLPRFLLTFSDYWNSVIHMPKKATIVKSVGFPYFESQVKKYRNNINKSENNVILFVSQGTIGRLLSKLAVELYSKLQGTNTEIIYKLHPGEYDDWKNVYPWLYNKDITVIDNSDSNIYEFFAKSSIQIGVYSTAIYEGLAFNLDTFIYNIGHADTMTDLANRGYIKIFNNIDELMSLLNTRTQNTYDINQLWKTNAMDNIVTILNAAIVGSQYNNPSFGYGGC